ncbi:MAG: polyribonucleotide nucleotidyltransferase [Candidatus Nealsonbacteria bacterium]|nr:MAG: polyribonucleotide nucleotidyltransferase [Candidatus Nealsonbacteria bacterium]
MVSKKFKLEIGKRELVADIKNLAEQSNGSVFLQYGDTLVLATAVMSDYEKEELSFFPLTVNYEERFYAAGKIKGPRYIKRETRPSDEAICNARLIDRSIRPLFPKNLNREVQVVITVLSWDGQNEPDILGLLASSLALGISDIPWKGPLATVRVGQIEDKFILNPTYEEREKSKIDIVFTCIEKEDVLINMIEGNFDEINEKLILKAYQFSKPYLKKLINFEKEIFEKIGKEKIPLTIPETEPELEKDIKDFIKDKLENAVYQKKGGKNGMAQLKEELSVFCQENYPEKISYAGKFFEKEIEKIIHKNILYNEKRPDGRKLDEIRELHCEVGIIPRTHGSGLFCRGQTKSLSILTLGAPGDVQLLEGMEIVGKKRFMHHYNFPPYSVGETRPIRGPGRREIGHGMLAEKAILPVIPSFDQFPYTTRIVSEILSSNGSTSMASISSSSLALMDAGVPIKSPVAGIALGLISDNKGNYKLLTDIQGPEDHYGNMDFKIAGTKKGVTVIQMDVKIDGISEEIFKKSLEKGRITRLEILENMAKVLEKPRPKLSPFAPRILIIQINPEKIRKVIGPGGKIINEIIEECGVSIDIEETGRVFITAEKEEAGKKALAWIKNITREVRVGEVFQGKVKRILNFGAFIEIVPGQEGLLHISRLAPHRVKRVEDVVKIGDIVPVKVISIDEQGRIDLSLNNKKHYRERKKSYARRK